MVDIFALALSHGLLLLAAWRLLSRPELDVEEARKAEPEPARRASLRKVRPAMKTGRRADLEAGDHDA